MFTTIKNRALSIGASDHGSALVTVIGALIATMAFGLAVTAASTYFSRESSRDRSVKRALAASEAGIQEARYRMNMLQPTESSPCVTTDSGGEYVLTSAGADGWCNAETIAMGSGNSSTYQISPYVVDNGVVTRKIVSTGTVNGVKRRIETTTSSNTGTPLFGSYAAQSDQLLELENNAEIYGAVRSNSDISLYNNAHIYCAETSGVTPGPGSEVIQRNNSSVCGSTDPASSLYTTTPVDQGDAPTNNDNNRFFEQDTTTGTVTFDARVLRMRNNATLTLSGHTYSICALDMENNSELIIAEGAVVRIYIDSTENCGYQHNALQFNLENNATIRNINEDSSYLQIYMMGGTPEQSNRAKIENNADVAEFVLYAPFTELTLDNNATITGAVVTRRVYLNNNSRITYDPNSTSITESTTGVYQYQKFVECTPVNSGSGPGDDC